MNEISFLDFELLVQRAKSGYRAQVVRSPAGEATTTFKMPFSPLEIENYLLRIGQRQRGTRRVDSPEMEAAKAFGGRLFQAVFDQGVQGLLSDSLNEASRQGKRLRIRLRLTEVPELSGLPWEFLFNPQLNRFLTLSIDTPLVRYLELPESPRPLTVTPPLRVLVMIASSSDYPQLDVEHEWSLLRKALSDLEQRGIVELARLDQATLSGLRRCLRSENYHIFHFIGHGGFDHASQEGVLVLEDENKRGRLVSGQDLGILLHNHATLRLAILNACEGARTSANDPFSGVAQNLIQQGIPAAIAMQFAITDEAAITFAHEFYGVLADGYPIDAALAEARMAIFTQGNGLEWGTPVLYLRAPDGRIFDVEATVPTPHKLPTGVGEEKSSQEIQTDFSGTMNSQSDHYVVRESDTTALQKIVQTGVTITIKGPRQVGKSSLLMRMIDLVKEKKCVALLDFQLIDKAALMNADLFFRQFCAWLTDELQMEDRTDEYWEKNKNLGNIQRCTRYMSRYILKELCNSLVIAMDEVDVVFDTSFRSDFFGMLRAWHNSRSNPNDLSWRNLDLILVTSTEPYFFIDNLTQSPFNVGLGITLEDFTSEQVKDLNRRYHSPLNPQDEQRLMLLLGGHPFLVRRAFSLVSKKHISVAGLFADTTSDSGPFGEHLRNLFLRLHEREELIDSLRQLIHRNVTPSQEVFFRLRGAGLVRKNQQGKVVLRCQLYADYFRENLHV